MQSMKKRLSDEQLLSRMITSTVVDALLSTLQIQSSAPVSDHSEEGTLLFGIVEQALGVFDLSLIPPPGANDERAYFGWPCRSRKERHLGRCSICSESCHRMG
jgi:hypothetical protein